MGFLFSIIALLYLQLHIASTVCRGRFSTKTMKSFKFIGKCRVSSKGHFLRRGFPPRIARARCAVFQSWAGSMWSSHTVRDPCITPMEKVMGLVKVQKERADRLRSPMPCLYALYIGDGGQISANPVPFDKNFLSIVVPRRR